MADLPPLAKIDFLRGQKLGIVQYLNNGVGILLNPSISQNCMPVTWGTYHNCFVGKTTSENNHVLARLKEIRKDIEGLYVDSRPGTCHMTTIKFQGLGLKKYSANTRTTLNEGLVAKQPEEVAHCAKILWSSESDVEECAEGEEGEKRKASHEEEEDGP